MAWLYYTGIGHWVPISPRRKSHRYLSERMNGGAGSGGCWSRRRPRRLGSPAVAPWNCWPRGRRKSLREFCRATGFTEDGSSFVRALRKKG